VDLEHKERIARNEARARDLNERFGLGTFVCECGDLGCSGIVRMPRDVYDSIRADGRRFFVLPGHEEPEVEEVVMRREDFFVVRKREPTAHIAEERNPRRFERDG
jgi:hypothetical protein